MKTTNVTLWEQGDNSVKISSEFELVASDGWQCWYAYRQRNKLMWDRLPPNELLKSKSEELMMNIGDFYNS